MTAKFLKINPRNIIGLLIAAAICFLPVAAQTPITKLEFGKTIEQTIKGGETQTFQFKLKKGEFVRVEVEQKDIDVVVSLLAPDGKSLIEMNGDYGFLWRESVSAISKNGGIYKLQIKGKGAVEKAGSYTAKIAEQRKSTANDSKRIEAEQNLAQAIKLSLENKPKDSILPYETSLKLWREIGDKYWEAVTEWNHAWNYDFVNRYDDSVKSFEQVLPVFQELNDRKGVSRTLQGLGVVWLDKKDYEKARSYLEQALPIRRELKDLTGEYNTLNNLLRVYFNLNQPEKVAESQMRMLAIRDERKDQLSKADAYKDIGKFYMDVYQYEKAAEFYEKALPMYQELKDKKNEIFLRMFLGLIYGSTSEYEKAKVHLERYAELIKETGEAGNWNAYQFLGMVYNALQQYDKVLSNYEKAVEIAKKVNDNRASEGFMLFLLGGFYDSKGEYDKAKSNLEEALKIARQNNNQNLEQSSLSSLASVYLHLREFEKAESYGEQSLAVQRKISKFNESNALNSNGLVYLNTGKYDKAIENFETSLKISREMKYELLEADNLNNLGLTYSSLGQYEKAIVFYQDSYNAAKYKNHPRRIISALNGLGSANNSLSRFEEAKKYFEEALNIANSLQLNQENASISSRLGNVYVNLSQYDKAREYLEPALKIAEQTGDKLQESLALTYLGRVYSNLNQYDKAREIYENVLRIGKETNNIYVQYDALTNLGFVNINFNQYDKAKDYLDKAGVLSKQIKSATSNIEVLYGLGAIYTDLNNPEKAASLIQQSLELVQNVKNRRGEGVILNKLGEVYLLSKQYDKAQEQYDKALAIAREVKSSADEASALISLGWVFVSKNQLTKAQDFYEKGLTLAGEVKSRGNEGSALDGLGVVYFKNKKYKEAEDFYRQSLGIAREVQSKKLEAGVLTNLMDLFNELKKAQVAVLYGKQAVNIFQEIRGNIKGFEKESQQNYLRDKESAYRTLANLLIADERFFEAQSVLNLLKTEEYSQLERNGEKGEIIPYSDVETKLLEQSAKLAQLQQQSDQLEKTENPTDEQLRQSGELRSKIDAANEAFDGTLKKMKSAVSQTTVKEQINNFYEEKGKGFQGIVTKLQKHTNSGVVALYTLIGKEDETSVKKDPRDEKTNFGWVILVSEKGQRAYPIDVKDFNQTVFQFRDALSSDEYDPRPVAKKLYDAIFRQKSAKTNLTLEQDLQQILSKYPNKTLMWSLDGVLRYIPMAALHDGKNYLAEQYLNTVFTDKSIGSLEGDKLPDWKILGLGVSEQREDFIALPGAKIELETIVREGNISNGILNGTIKLNENFKKELFFRMIKSGNYPVVHIASHYNFKPTQQNDSFLLVGDGHLTFGELKGDNLFGGIDLLTLSACDTGATGNGTETEGFPIKAQQLGAKSVLASLWQVSDAGTPELMIRFYKLMAENSSMTKGEAFRQAQLSLLKGSFAENKPENSKIPRAEIVGSKQGDLKLPLFVKDERKPFAHPHYWSSFVLIGNWR